VFENELEQRPNVRLAIIDPIKAYVGRTKIDDHKTPTCEGCLGT